MFPKPRLVTFDAFGTLFRPRKAIAQIYIDFLNERFPHENLPSRDQVGAQFKQAFSEAQRQFPIYGRNDKSTSVEKWWSDIIRSSFEPVKLSQDAVKGLVDYFNSSGPYRAFDDVNGCLTSLLDHGIATGVISNSDPRIRDVLSGMGLAQALAGVAISYETGFEKPSREAFVRGVADIAGDAETELSKVWHVGDELSKDLEGAVNAGINGIWVDRESQVLNNGEKYRIVNDAAPWKIYVSSLEIVPKLFSH